MRKISELKLEEVILEGVVLNAKRGIKGIKPEHLGKVNFEGKAVLIHTGWDKFWKDPEYFNHPFLTEKLAEFLVDGGAKLVGIDTINIDNPEDLSRPAHTILLRKEIPIVENLANLGKLLGRRFRFYAVPLKIDAAAFPVRAFAEIL